MASEPLVAQFADAIEKVIDQFRDEGLTVAEALGVLDIVHAKIVRDSMEDDP